MEVAFAERDLELDAREEIALWVEDEPVAAGVELGGEIGDTAVGPGHTCGDELLRLEELDEDAARRPTAAGVEDVGGE